MMTQLIKGLKAQRKIHPIVSRSEKYANFDSDKYQVGSTVTAP